MRKKLFFLAVVVFSMALLTNSAFARGGGGGGGTTTINIDKIFMVGSYGSTTRQDIFALNEVPWLYFELPSGAGTNNIVTQSWWYDPDGAQQWYISQNNADNTVQVWHTIGTNWDSVEVIGDWSVNAKYDATGSGTTGTGNTGFTVTPEPVSSILFLSGGATLVFRRYWKRRKNV